MVPRRGRYTVVDQQTGEVQEKTKIPYQLEGKGYTMQSHGAEVPLYALGLTGSEWSIIDWLKEHGAACEPIRVHQEIIADEINATQPTVKSGLARLVKLGVAIRTAPRSSTYQLNPLRFWEGAAGNQARHLTRSTPPRIQPDKKAESLSKDKRGRGKENVRSIESGKRRNAG